MPRGEPTIWEMLEECVRSGSSPMRASEIVGWFRRHHPDVKEPSLRAHIQYATSNASPESRGAFVGRVPLITRVGHGMYERYGGDRAVPRVSNSRTTTDPVPDPEAPKLTPRPVAGEAWLTESHVQSMVVAHLVQLGWGITSVADTASRAHGIDVVAVRGEETVAVEVKGYPGRTYADPSRQDEVKTTHPSAQAGTYYAQAILSALRLRTKRPELLSVIAFPDVARYRRLGEETLHPLSDCGVEIWLVGEDGTVTRLSDDSSSIENDR